MKRNHKERRTEKEKVVEGLQTNKSVGDTKQLSKTTLHPLGSLVWVSPVQIPLHDLEGKFPIDNWPVFVNESRYTVTRGGKRKLGLETPGEMVKGRSSSKKKIGDESFSWHHGDGLRVKRES